MSLTALPTIEISPLAKRHGLFFSVVGAVLATAAVLVLSVGTPAWQLAALLASMPSVLLLGFGLYRASEPTVSIRLTEHYLQYFHRAGSWTLHWHDIQRVDQPHLGLETGYQPLDYVGLRLHQPLCLLDTISLRLAARLLIEQRPIWLQVLATEQGLTIDADSLVEPDQIRVNGERDYQGLLAMLAYRMKRLHSALGYDLYLPDSAFDRPLEEAVSLLKHYHQQALLQRELEAE